MVWMLEADGVRGRQTHIILGLLLLDLHGEVGFSLLKCVHLRLKIGELLVFLADDALVIGHHFAHFLV